MPDKAEQIVLDRQDPDPSNENVSSGRPIFHFVPPRGWINDPCAPGYDVNNKVFHLSYQWNPHSPFWNHISWGHATSPDLLTWKYTDIEPSLVPDQPYDCKGIFTGCYCPTKIPGEDDAVGVYYSSVNHLPPDASDPAVRGWEGVSLAYTKDVGKTWTKYANNPLVAEEPEGLFVTGFRDPYVVQIPALAQSRGEPEDTHYGLLAGGVHHHGPCVFYYKVEETVKWTYMGVLVEVSPPSYFPHPKWSGDFGLNWECPSVVSIRQDGQPQATEYTDLLIVGAERGAEREWVTKYHEQNPQAARRVPRYSHACLLETKQQSAATPISIATPGLLDWGILYACNAFRLPDGRTIVWVWLIEEDLSKELSTIKAWTGCLGVPRELFLQTTQDVASGWTSSLSEIKHLQAHSQDSLETYKVTCLGMRPLQEFSRLRKQTLYDSNTAPSLSVGTQPSLLTHATQNYELYAVVSPFAGSRHFTLHIRHDDALSSTTDIVIEFAEERLRVKRERSNRNAYVNKCEERASHTLFKVKDGSLTKYEQLKLRVLVDHDVIEIFANERCALATRVYTPARCNGVSVSGDGDMRIDELKIWEMGSIGLVEA